MLLILIIPIASASENNESFVDDNIESVEVNNGNEWYVDGNTTVDGDGSQKNPFNNLNLALNHASDNDTIYVNSGVYNGANNTNLVIKQELTIQGIGDVIFDGNSSNRIFTVTGNNVVLNGIVFKSGNSSISNGGAISWSGNNGIIANSTFENNIADKTDTNTYGGAVSIAENVNMLITDSTFKNNQAYGSGAIDNEGNLKIVNCYFENNSAVNRDGGAISNVGTLTLTNSTFTNNFASRNGGAIKNILGTVKIYDSLFIANSANGVYKDCYGGALYQWDDSHMEVYNSKFINNNAARGAGSIFAHSGYVGGYADLYVYGCEFINNSVMCGSSISLITAGCNVSNSVFVNESIYSTDKNVSFDNNWWGTNNPNWSSLLVNIQVPKSYAVLNVSVDNNNVKINKEITLTANLLWNGTNKLADVSSRPINLSADGGILKDNNGTLNFNTTFKSDVSNNYTITAVVDNEIQKVNVTVENVTSILTVPDVIMYYKDGTRLVAHLTDLKGNPLAGKLIYITINGVTVGRDSDKNGDVSIAINLASNIYNITSYYKEDNLTVNSTLTVKSTISSSDVVKIFKNQTQYHATFTDNKGNLLANREVQFNINGVFYKRNTNANGIASLNINLNPGTYVITAINPENNEQIGNTVTVMPNIADNKNLVKYFRNDSQYVVKLLSDDGKALGAGVNVTFNINGVFYTRTTNSEGIATLKINLNPGDYIITANYNGCEVSNNITVKPTIESSDVTLNQGQYFELKVHGGDGKLLANQDVKFNVNGVFYNKVSDSDGIAKLKINLNPGNYIITSYCNDCVVSNNMLVKENAQISSITALDIVKDSVSGEYVYSTPILKDDQYYISIYLKNGTLVDNVVVDANTGKLLGKG